MESTMPQNNPMSVIETVKAICGCFENQSVKVFAIEDIIKARDAQLIRSTLEAAAERFCKICPGPGCPGECRVDDKSECGYWRTILEPLPNPDGIESATLDEVNHRRGFDK